ncbi:hypothetical protein [Nonomuraea recticatena]|uniref:Uncharacterized protein n=1 Tax=Nonomuraea recticatena TaxID=46178 RepID=A0ABP6FIM9_9ACTN
MTDSKGKTGLLADAARLLRFLGQSWRSADASVRRGAVIMWCVGLLFVVFGVVGDVLRAWWSSMPFLTNLLTSATAFFFAVPFAVLVLQEASHRMADRAGRRAATDLLLESTHQLEKAAATLWPGEHSRHSPTGDRPITTTSVLVEAYEKVREMGKGDDDGREVAQILRTAINQWRLDQPPAQFRELAGRVGREVHRLRDVVRPRFLQLDLEWPLDQRLGLLSEAVDAVIRRGDWYGEGYNSWFEEAESYIQAFAKRPTISRSDAHAVMKLLERVKGVHRDRTMFMVRLSDCALRARETLRGLPPA